MIILDTKKINYCEINFYLFILLLFTIGCSSQEIYVYEKIPESVECYSFKEYSVIEACNRKQQIILREKLTKVIENDNSLKLD